MSVIDMTPPVFGGSLKQTMSLVPVVELPTVTSTQAFRNIVRCPQRPPRRRLSYPRRRHPARSAPIDRYRHAPIMAEGVTTTPDNRATCLRRGLQEGNDSPTNSSERAHNAFADSGLSAYAFTPPRVVGSLVNSATWQSSQ